MIKQRNPHRFMQGKFVRRHSDDGTYRDIVKILHCTVSKYGSNTYLVRYRPPYNKELTVWENQLRPLSYGWYGKPPEHREQTA